MRLPPTRLLTIPLGYGLKMIGWVRVEARMKVKLTKLNERIAK